MTSLPPLSDNIQEFLHTLEAALEYADLNLGYNFGIKFTDPHPEHGIGAMFCQLNLRRSRVSFKRAKQTLVMVFTEGLAVQDEFGNDQIMPFSERQPPHRVAAMLAVAMVTQKPLVAPTCPHCLAEHEQAVAS
tara:strand:+ start:4916 stop:5314 length:399 start_codon:yes stop_codon:yes gene_type:complete